LVNAHKLIEESFEEFKKQYGKEYHNPTSEKCIRGEKMSKDKWRRKISNRERKLLKKIHKGDDVDERIYSLDILGVYL
jgi:hypothetical protein